MSSRAARTLAHAIRHGARRHEEETGRKVYRGVVTVVSPLAVDLLGADLNLDDVDVQLSQDVERYKASEGLHVGDELALIEVEHGEFIATTVISDTTIRAVP